MRLTRAESFLYPVRYALTDIHGADFETGTLDHVLLKLTAEDGHVGWGEGFGYRAAAATFAALDQIVLPLLDGLDVETPETVYDHLSRVCHQAGLAGPVLYARAAVDIALWDLVGQRTKRPLHQHLGSAEKTDLPAYSSLLRCDHAGLVAAKCADRAGNGYGAIKLHEFRPEVVAAARQAMGSDLKLMLDTNCAWTTTEAIERIGEMKRHQLYWVEEPVFPPDDTAALASVRNATRQRIAAGENAATVADFSALAEAGLADVLQPSITKVGGVTPMKRLLTECARNGREVALHSPYYGPGFLATMHFIAASDQDMMVEFYDPDRLDGLPYGKRLIPSGGHVAVPSGNGLGLTPDDAIIAEAAIARGDISFD